MTKRVHYIFTLMAMLLMLVCTERASAQLAVKTDIVKWALTMPNAGVEFTVGKKWTIDLSAYGCYKMYGNDIKLITVQPEVRYWLSGRRMARLFVGATAFGTHYDVKWDSEYRKGDAIGAGLTFGYVWYLSDRCSVEAYCGWGVAAYKEERTSLKPDYDDYFDTQRPFSNAQGYIMCPAKLGVSFTYLLR